MLWKVFQFSVAFAVIASNIEYQWTENNYAAGLLALLAAGFATALVSSLIDVQRRLRGLEGSKTTEQSGGLGRQLRRDPRE